jgi:hypothetical protein
LSGCFFPGVIFFVHFWIQAKNARSLFEGGTVCEAAASYGGYSHNPTRIDCPKSEGAQIRTLRADLV